MRIGPLQFQMLCFREDSSFFEKLNSCLERQNFRKKPTIKGKKFFFRVKKSQRPIVETRQ